MTDAMTTPKPLTMAEFDKLTPGEQAAWTRYLLRDWQRNADADLVDDEVRRAVDGLGEERERQEGFGGGDE